MIAIAAGYTQSLALLQNGNVIAWGCGRNTNSGQCEVPRAVRHRVTAIAAGWAVSLAVTQPAQ